MLFADPQSVGAGLPFRGDFDRARAIFIDVFGREDFGGLGAAFVHHVGQTSRVVEHRAGTQHVLIEGLVLVVFHEHRSLQAFQQALVTDVVSGVVDEHARIHIAVGVDMQIATPAGDAAAHVFSVVEEVEREQHLLIAELANLLVHEFALFGLGDQIDVCTRAHGHVAEEPAELRAPIDHLVEEFGTADDVDVLAGVTGRDAEGELVLAQQAHGHFGLVEGTFAAARVRGFFGAFHGDDGNEVLHTQQFVAKSLVDERSVGEAKEFAVVVLVADGHKVLLAHQRFAAGVDVHVATEFLALADDRIDLIEAQVELVAVFAGPAADAVLVAGAGGIEQDGPRDVALVFLAHLDLLFPSQKGTVHDEVVEGGLDDLVVDVVPEAADHLVPVVVGVVENAAELVSLAFHHVARCHLVHKIHDFGEVGLGVLFEVIEDFVQTIALDGVGETHVFSFPRFENNDSQMNLGGE